MQGYPEWSDDEPEYAVHRVNADALHVPFFMVKKRMIG
jgi:hypothetical protein